VASQAPERWSAVRTARVRVCKCAKCGQVQVEAGRAFKCAGYREAADAAGLPEGFRHQDLRHYFASLLIAHGADVKIDQARLRGRVRPPEPTLDTYGHL
jgi:integrase